MKCLNFDMLLGNNAPDCLLIVTFATKWLVTISSVYNTLCHFTTALISLFSDIFLISLDDYHPATIRRCEFPIWFTLISTLRERAAREFIDPLVTANRIWYFALWKYQNLTGVKSRVSEPEAFVWVLPALWYSLANVNSKPYDIDQVHLMT